MNDSAGTARPAPAAFGTELGLLPATEQLRLLRARELSCVALVEHHIDTIERVNPHINAIVTETFGLARREAKRVDRELAKGRTGGALGGLTIAHKDTIATKGIRTTLGSPLYANHVPEQDALIVERVRRAGAITVGKTNVPEFSAGSQTYNRVFGATRNPYDTSLTCGGSSGGAAAALACGMVALANGTDLGGSLRNPASFCNVVGLRPSPGRVPVWPTADPWDPLGVHGPMGRTAADVALQLSAIAGSDPRCPLPPLDALPSGLLLDRDFRGARVAWSRNLSVLPVEPAVTEVLEANRTILDQIGCVVEEVEPDFAGAEEAFVTGRARLFELNWGRHYDEARDQLGEDVQWNIEAGRRLSDVQLAAAAQRREALRHRTEELFHEYQFLLAPVVQVLPFPIELSHPRTVAGVSMGSYIEWMKSCYFVSAAAVPAASVPFGFTPQGLPVGLQVIGPYGGDWGVLQLAHAIEQETQFWRRRPQAIGNRDHDRGRAVSQPTSAGAISSGP